MIYGICGHGRMGKLVEKVLKGRGVKRIEIIDPPLGMPWPASLSSDMYICFTTPDAGYETTKKILKSGKNAVVGTTKFYVKADGSEDMKMLREFEELAEIYGGRMAYSVNFSAGTLGIAENLKSFATTMKRLGFGTGILDLHHIRKQDWSGTGKMLGNIVLEVYSPEKTELNLGDANRKLEGQEISMAGLRVGDEPGTHYIVFSSPDDSVEIVHRVRNPETFVRGALDNADWLITQPFGVYRGLTKERVFQD